MYIPDEIASSMTPDELAELKNELKTIWAEDGDEFAKLLDDFHSLAAEELERSGEDYRAELEAK